MQRARHLSVIGAGYVGLATAVALAVRGHEIDLVETRSDRREALLAGTMPIHEPAMLAAFADPEIRARIHPLGSPRPGADLILVCVGTPVDAEGHSDLSQVEAALGSVAEYVVSGTPVVIRSTLPAGIGEAIAARVGGHGSRVFSNPEFLRQGTALEDFLQPTRVVIGTFDNVDEDALAMVKEVLHHGDSPLLVVGMAEADLIKNGSNAFLSLRLSFANELAVLCEALDADVLKVIEGIGFDPRIGIRGIQPSFGFGGSCLPKDLCALTNVGKSRGVRMHVAEAASEANSSHQRHFADRIEGLMTSGSRRIAMLGLAFKAGTDDVRSSPALNVARMLLERGFEVVGFDPHASGNAARELPGLSIADSPEAAIAGAGVVVIATEWPEFRDLDWAGLAATMASPTVIDGRRLLDGKWMREHGYRYEAVGAPSLDFSQSPLSPSPLH